MEDKTIIDKYIETCLLREKALIDNKPKIANKYYDEIMGYYMELKAGGKLSELKPFLFHTSPSVKTMAASHLLTEDEETAKKVLKNIVETEKGIEAFNAKMVLKEWDKGNLKNYL